jgi:hypothetical protein
MSEELIIAGTNELVPVTDEAALLAEMLADAGQGLENVTAADIAIPYLKLLQKASPEVEDGNPAQIEGAAAGHVLDTVTRQLVDMRESKQRFALIVPVTFEHLIVTWRPKKAGGGIVRKQPYNKAVLDAAQVTVNDDGKTILLDTDSNILEDTMEYHVLMLTPEGTTHWAILAMSSGKLGPARKLMALINGKTVPGTKKTAPLFSHLYKMTVFLDKSKRTGDMFQNFRFVDHGAITDPALYRAAKDFRSKILAGAVKAADETLKTEPNSDDYNGDF